MSYVHSWSAYGSFGYVWCVILLYIFDFDKSVKNMLSAMIMQIVIKVLLVNILFMSCLSLFFKIISIFVCPSVSDQIYSNILGWRRSCWVVCLIVDYLDLWLVGVFIWLDRALLYAEVDILMSPIFLVSFIYEKHVPSELVGVFSVFFSNSLYQVCGLVFVWLGLEIYYA